MPDKAQQLEIEKAYERYVTELLDIMKRKLDVVTKFRIKAGKEKIAKLENSNTIINCLVGSIGVLPTIEAIKSKKNIIIGSMHGP